MGGEAGWRPLAQSQRTSECRRPFQPQGRRFCETGFFLLPEIPVGLEESFPEGM